MPTIYHEKIVPYSSEQMYQLVNDIEAYPHFVPACKSSHILRRDEKEIRAQLTFAKGGLQHTFSTRNELYPSERIVLHLLEGPFRHLQGTWQFQTEPSIGSRITLHLNFEFSSRLLALACGPLLEQAAQKLIEAFYKRAETLYGHI